MLKPASNSQDAPFVQERIQLVQLASLKFSCDFFFFFFLISSEKADCWTMLIMASSASFLSSRLVASLVLDTTPLNSLMHRTSLAMA